MKKETIYYFESHRGCGLRAYKNLQQAEKEILREVGTADYQFCRKATKDDINGVKAMGGYVPDV